MNEANTGRTVRFTLAPDTPLSAEDKALLAKLASMPDSAIDYSDIPPSPADAQWTRPGIPFQAGNKRQVTLQLDADVLDFFQHASKRYQTRINSILREYMRAHAPKV